MKVTGPHPDAIASAPHSQAEERRQALCAGLKATGDPTMMLATMIVMAAARIALRSGATREHLIAAVNEAETVPERPNETRHAVGTIGVSLYTICERLKLQRHHADLAMMQELLAMEPRQ